MVNYEFYVSEYHGGAISLDEWPEVEARASAQLRRYKRIFTVSAPEPNAEDMAICAMAEAIHGFDLSLNGDGGPIQSASVGSVSTSYGTNIGTAIDLSEKGQSKTLYRAASLYLDIYRGVSG